MSARLTTALKAIAFNRFKVFTLADEEDEFDAAILGATFRGVVRGDRLSRPESNSRDLISLQSTGVHEVIANRFRTALRQPLIGRCATLRVRVAFDAEFQVGVLLSC